MQTEAIEAFVSICELGSFQAAADALHLTQPAVSKRLANLEDRLGHTLFDRVGRGVALTEAGRAYLPHAREMIAVLADGVRELESLGAHVGGPLSLALSHHVGLHRMPPILRAFVRDYPDVSPTIRFVDSEAACRLVAHGECELAVITLPTTPHQALRLHPIWRDPLQIFVSRDHDLADTINPGPAMLAKYASLLPPAGSTTRNIIDRALQNRGVSISARMESHYLETLRMLAGVGLGWTVLPSAMSRGELIAPGFDLPMARNLGVVTHPHRSLSNAASVLIQMLEAAQQPTVTDTD